MSYGVTTQSKSVENLFAGDFPRIEKPVTIALGEGALTRGTVLGKITKGAVTSAAKTGGNTGDGTLVLDVTTPLLANAKAGVYTVRIVRAALAEVATTPAVPAQKAIAEFKDPQGNTLTICDVPTSSGITISNQLKFVLTEGSTPFALGDGFNITVAAGSGQYGAYDDTAVNGLETAKCILAENVDATSATVNTTAFFSGEFTDSATVLVGLDAAAKVDFEDTSIFIKKVY